LDVVNLLNERLNYPKDVKDTCRTTPLMDAVRSGFHVENARRLMDSKVCSCE
jgi:hypothetical protein